MFAPRLTQQSLYASRCPLPLAIRPLAVRSKLTEGVDRAEAASEALLREFSLVFRQLFRRIPFTNALRVRASSPTGICRSAVALLEVPSSRSAVWSDHRGGRLKLRLTAESIAGSTQGSSAAPLLVIFQHSSQRTPRHQTSTYVPLLSNGAGIVAGPPSRVRT